jgi:4-diphosphocytidyl-2-C-methyl-D-erythritol kinase
MRSEWSEWPAPAKLNLFLHVVGLRADGYHELETVFQLLDFGDTLRLRVRADGAIVRTLGPAGVASETDLAVRAARLLQSATGAPSGAEIEVDKRIPVGGGLGGGSSDAATVLVALNRLWRTGLSIDRLAQLGLALGADVPVFVRGRSAYASGIGEVLTPVTLSERSYLVIDPGQIVPTGELFQAPDLTRNTPRSTISRFLAGDTTRNDFEPVVRRRYPKVAAALDWLAQFAPSRLTGSGGCVFAAFESEQEARRIAATCPTQFAAHVALGVNESPLHAAVQG